MNYCSQCGNQLIPDGKFCINCGLTIRESEINRGTKSFGNQGASGISPIISSSGQQFRMPNTQRRIVNLWIILTLIFLGCVFLPSWLGINGMDGGFGLSFLAGFMVIVGLIVIVIYNGRAKQLEKILSGEGRIALWHYTSEEWIRFIAADFEAEKQEKKNLFILVTVISLIIGVILTVIYQDGLMLLIVTGIIVIVAVPAFWAPRYRYRKLRHSQAVALIAENGVIVGKMFHLWVKMGASLDRVVINRENNPNLMEFTYSFPARHGRQVEVARVPIPYGKSEEAVRIAEHF
jgi:hypothetical protein